jgi:hypothetical protein
VESELVWRPKTVTLYPALVSEFAIRATRWSFARLVVAQRATVFKGEIERKYKNTYYYKRAEGGSFVDRGNVFGNFGAVSKKVSGRDWNSWRAIGILFPRGMSICCFFLFKVFLGQNFEAKAQSTFGLEPMSKSGSVFRAPTISFEQDSVLLGSPVRLSLRLYHSARERVLFPDSTYNFSPFELNQIRFFPTLTRDTISRDSVEYDLVLMNPGRENALELPVFYLLPSGDSFPVYSNQASIAIRLLEAGVLVGAKSDTTLVPSLALAEMNERFNYPYWLLGITLLVIVAVGANQLFGRPLERYFALFILQRKHKAFVRGFERLNDQAVASSDIAVMERALTYWKAYIETLGEEPYSTYSTKDFADRMPEAGLTRSLRQLDRWIYGGFKPEGVEVPFKVLKRFSQKLYSLKANQLSAKGSKSAKKEIIIKDADSTVTF